MKSVKPLVIKVLFFSFVLLLAGHGQVWAQASNPTATPTPYVDSGLGVSTEVVGDPPGGSVVCQTNDSVDLCSRDLDVSLYGVISKLPALALENFDPGAKRLVMRSGIAKVRVSTVNGEIKKGALLSSSTTAGVAGVVKNEDGYVLGVALEDYSGSDEGLIDVALNIHFNAQYGTNNKSNLTKLLRGGLSSYLINPLNSLRYVLAALVLLVSFVLGITYFGRISRSGVESIGRNPLAKKSIQFSIFLSLLLSLVMVFVGLGLAYLILVL